VAGLEAFEGAVEFVAAAQAQVDGKNRFFPENGKTTPLEPKEVGPAGKVKPLRAKDEI